MSVLLVDIVKFVGTSYPLIGANKLLQTAVYGQHPHFTTEKRD